MFLFDASSIMRAIRESRTRDLAGGNTQWLAIYETLNAIWRESFLTNPRDPGSLDKALKLARNLPEIFTRIKILDPRGLEEEILKIAIEAKLTVYDASYIALSRKHNLVLVTEDRELRKKASNIVRAVGLNNI